MIMYTQELLAELFGKVRKIDGDFVPIPDGATPAIAQRLRNIHANNQSSQKRLRDTMKLVMPPNLDPRVAQRRFFHTFGIDTLSATGLTSAEADNLRQRILTKLGVVTT